MGQVKTPRPELCTVEGCTRKCFAIRLCNTHYAYRRKHGPFPKARNLTAKERIEEFSIPVPESGCWLWTRHLAEGGYGSFGEGGKHHRAHRIAYEVYVGPIPEGMFVCHKCDTRSCCNPDHLFLGTQSDNIKDMYRKGRGRKLKNGGIAGVKP